MEQSNISIEVNLKLNFLNTLTYAVTPVIYVIIDFLWLYLFSFIFLLGINVR